MHARRGCSRAPRPQPSSPPPSPPPFPCPGNVIRVRPRSESRINYSLPPFTIDAKCHPRSLSFPPPESPSAPREEARVFDLDSARFLERNPRRCRGGERKKKDSRAIDFVTRWPRSLVTRNFIQILCRLHRYRLLFQLRRGRL